MSAIRSAVALITRLELRSSNLLRRIDNHQQLGRRRRHHRARGIRRRIAERAVSSATVIRPPTLTSSFRMPAYLSPSAPSRIVTGAAHLRKIVEAIRQLELERAPVDDVDGGVDARNACRPSARGAAALRSTDASWSDRCRPSCTWCGRRLIPPAATSAPWPPLRRAADRADARAAPPSRRSTRSRRGGRSTRAQARAKTRHLRIAAHLANRLKKLSAFHCGRVGRFATSATTAR